MTDHCKVLLTADNIMMSNYGNSLFYGFLASTPTKLNRYLSPSPFLRIIFDKIPSDDVGRAIFAPHGLRRVESALLESGAFTQDEVVVAHPDHISRFLHDSTKIIGISAIDPFGKGPASTTFAGSYGLIHSEPVNAYNFRKLVTSDAVQNARRRGAKVVVGGAGAWQLTIDEMKSYGIDVVVDGESDLLFSQVVNQIMSSAIQTPCIIKTDYKNIPEADQIPHLRGGTIGGLVEISRGCGRGCRFCMPTLRKIRHRSVEDIIRDVKVNVANGQPIICLHAEDVLRYGSFKILPDPDKVVNLFRRLMAVKGVGGLCASHVALATIAVTPKTVTEMSEIMGLSKHNWMGFQTGIETGSPRLVEELMNMKPAPYKPHEWHYVVENAFSICNDNNWVPAATLVVNLPGETEDDVAKTTELVDKLRDYRSFIVPLLFVPFSGSGGRNMRMLEDAEYYHFELYRSIWRHDVRWMKSLSDDYMRYNNVAMKIAMKGLVSFLTGYADGKVQRYIEKQIVKRKARFVLQQEALAQPMVATISNQFNNPI